jgi:hypothetical protein
MRRLLLTGVILHLSVISGCSTWTQDVQNKLPSVRWPSLPALPSLLALPKLPALPSLTWDSSVPPPAVTPTQLGFDSDDAASMAGPVLVIPSASGAYHYRFYPADQNHCADDVRKMTASRPAYPSDDPGPYCTDKPTAPTAKTGSFMGF